MLFRLVMTNRNNKSRAAFRIVPAAVVSTLLLTSAAQADPMAHVVPGEGGPLPASPASPVLAPAPNPPPADTDKDRPLPQKTVLHGFRVGYAYIANYDDPQNPNSPKVKYNLRSPSQSLIGYEVMARMVGHDWLNVIFVGNVMVTGLEQSRVLPSANALIGFEINNSFQIGMGANVSADKDKPAHMVAAAGWMPRAGSFYVPVHVFVIPDVDGNHRMGMTVGVNW